MTKEGEWQTLVVLAWDEVMLVFGLLHSVSGKLSMNVMCRVKCVLHSVIF